MLKVHKYKLLLIFLSFKYSIRSDLSCPFADDEICQKAIADKVTPCNEINGDYKNDYCNKYQICLEALKDDRIGDFKGSDGLGVVTCSDICKYKSDSPPMGLGENWAGEMLLNADHNYIDENGYCIF